MITFASIFLLYVGENESAKYHHNGLKRTAEFILIACVDGLNGFPAGNIECLSVYYSSLTENYVISLYMRLQPNELELFKINTSSKYPKIYKSWLITGCCSK